jgi:hypothetical protein
MKPTVGSWIFCFIVCRRFLPFSWYLIVLADEPMMGKLAIGKRGRVLQLGQPSTLRPSHNEYLYDRDDIETGFESSHTEQTEDLFNVCSDVDQKSAMLETRPGAVYTRVIPQSEDSGRLVCLVPAKNDPLVQIRC